MSPSAYPIHLVPFVRNNSSKTHVSVTENRRSVTRWPEPWGSSAQTERAVPALIRDADGGGRPSMFSAFQRAVHPLWALVLGSLSLLYLALPRCSFVVPVRCFPPSFSWSASSHRLPRRSRGRRRPCVEPHVVPHRPSPPCASGGLRGSPHGVSHGQQRGTRLPVSLLCDESFPSL